MSPALLVARHEYRRRVRTRSFVLGTLLAPVLAVAFSVIMGGFAVLSAGSVIERLDAPTPGSAAPGPSPLPLALGFLRDGPEVDTLAASLGTSATVTVVGPAAAWDSLSAGRLDAVVVPSDRTANGWDVVTAGTGARFGDAVEALHALGPPDLPAAPASAAEPATVDAPDVNEIADVGRSMLAMALGTVIAFMSLFYGSQVLRGVIEDKADRVVELLASSVRPFDLMMGKVLGIGAVGLTQVVVWSVLGAAGLAGGLVVVKAASPEAAAVLDGIAGALTPGLVLALIALFLSGYLLTASVYAAVGSAVDKESDAQNLMAPLMMVTLLPMALTPTAAFEPEGPLAVVLSLLPPVSPVVMAVRLIAGSVPAWQLALSLVLLAAGFVVAVAAAARVYRVGLLMYGTTPTLADLWRWARTP